jgi:hypothetical protein
MLKNIGLCLCPRSHRLFSQENNKIAKHQRQKIQGITFAWKSVAFILKEKKWLSANAQKIQGKNLHSSAK